MQNGKSVAENVPPRSSIFINLNIWLVLNSLCSIMYVPVYIYTAHSYQKVFFSRGEYFRQTLDSEQPPKQADT